MVSFTNPLAGSFAARQRSNPPSIRSAEPAFVPPANRARYVPNSASQAFPLPEVIPELMESNPTIPTSRTWTPSTKTLNFSNDGGEEQDRVVFVEKYNQVATKHGVRPLVAGDFDAHLRNRSGSSSPEKKSWLSRLFRGSSNQSMPKKAAPGLWAHKRSTSDLGSSIHSKSEPRILDIQDLVRLTGSSLLYLPPGFSPHPLALPTCIRATAHYLAESPDFRGVFRIPGSVKNTKALYGYYCDASGSDLHISSTTYQPTLPTSIPHHLHDVASTFKRILKGLPIGVLGSITLLDAFLAIYSQLQNRLDVPAEKLKKTRARLIALAIQTIDSRLQRDLICAVFGLLSLIGHATEQSPASDADGRASAPSELMSYHALGIIFGSLLVGLDELDNYDIKESSSASGLSLVPIPAKERRNRQKAKGRNPDVPDFFKVKVLNNIAEMVISNWQDVVRQMVLLAANPDQKTVPMEEKHEDSEPSICDSFVVNHTMDLGVENGRDLSAEDESLDFTTASLSLRRTRSTIAESLELARMATRLYCIPAATKKSVDYRLKIVPLPAPSTETIRCGQANGFYEHTRWMAPHLKAIGQDGSIVIHEKPRLPDLVSIGSDGSHDDDNSKHSCEDKTPTKRRSVKALAAMFEDPHESPLTTRKPKVAASKDAFGLADGAYQDKQALYQIYNSSHTPYHLTKTPHGHPEAAGDVELKPMNDAQESSANKKEGLLHVETQERGIQTDAPLYTSPINGTENNNNRLQELETLLSIKSAEVTQLQLRVQQLEESHPASLSEQLREASTEIQKWREKAEAAERKAARFQRFTTRIRSIHSSLAMAEGSRQSGDDEVISLEGRDAEGSYRATRVRFTKSLGSEASGVARFDGVVAEDVQDDLHESKSDEEAPSMNGLGQHHRDFHGLDGVTSPRMVDFGSAAVAMWIAAQEYLEMEEGEASGSVEVTTSGSSLDAWEMADEDF
ncbi:hypothetical protein Trihar35433_2235 [Trichoderma harzianum]|nr:hypothetical protein Trihar35433_2235 [Trichoderma harzianum]